jgi:A/G-specific adenine glycosylase
MTVAPKTSPDHDRNAALLSWYEAEHRNLPWRRTADPYAILVAEVMLQQTQAERVIPFYDRFLARFPTTAALAAAPLSDVLEAWSGLGYNSRAQRLHDAARIVARSGWPQTPAALEELPGVGPYTAAAVGSFAFGLAAPAVDTNVRRVLNRWHGEPLRGAVLATVATTDMADTDAAAWNQAMMELGATRCTPQSPSCPKCPVAGWCAGPEVYVPPRVQRRFEGSGRQLRGAIVRRLVTGPASLEQLAEATGFELGWVEEALADLESERLVVAENDSFRLAD